MFLRISHSKYKGGGQPLNCLCLQLLLMGGGASTIDFTEMILKTCVIENKLSDVQCACFYLQDCSFLSPKFAS